MKMASSKDENRMGLIITRKRKATNEHVRNFESPNRLLVHIYSVLHSSIMRRLTEFHGDGGLSSLSADLVLSVEPPNLLEFVSLF
jgi:hypothetical protein